MTLFRILHLSFLFLLGSVAMSPALPIFFVEKTGGQTENISYVGYSQAFQMDVRADGIVFRSAGKSAELRFLKANPSAHLSGRGRTSTRFNLYRGNDPSQWVTGRRTLQQILYSDVYRGIDVLLYDFHGSLGLDFLADSGADVSQIEMQWNGVKAGSVQEREWVGRLRVVRKGSIAGRRREAQLSSGPSLVYSSFIPGPPGSPQMTMAMAVATNGSVYITGVIGYLRRDVMVVKIRPDGTAVEYYTILAGSDEDQGRAIAVDSQGNAYVTGRTASINFPLQKPLPDSYGGGVDAFVCVLDAAGQLVFSTYYGGGRAGLSYSVDTATSIAVDSQRNVVIAGSTSSTDLPVTEDAFDRRCGNARDDCYTWTDGFIARIDPWNSTLLYGTYLGGRYDDSISDLYLDAHGAIYVTGRTYSSNFPTTEGAFDRRKSPLSFDAFVTKIRPGNKTLEYSTFLGGSKEEESNAIAVDASGSAIVAGATRSDDFPLQNPFQSNHKGGVLDGFLARLDPAGERLVYSTYVGGSGQERVRDLAVNAAGAVFAVGNTGSRDFPTANAIQPKSGGYMDCFILKVNRAGKMLYSTYLGGGSTESAVAVSVKNGVAFVSGWTFSKNFPQKNAIPSESDSHVFLAKIR